MVEYASIWASGAIHRDHSLLVGGNLNIGGPGDIENGVDPA